MKVVIDTQRSGQRLSNTPQFAALQDALESTGQWHELTIVSFPPEESASQLDFQVARPMDVLKVLHVAAGCVNSPSVTHLLDLVPTGAPLSELGLSPLFASAYFLQPQWFPILQNLTVLIVNGRGIHEPFQLFPAFTQLQRFEADHLSLPIYEPNANLPLLHTLQKLCIRACSVQWMAGREFPYLVECAILLPQCWRPLQQDAVILPTCTKFTYYGYPITTVQYFHVPKMNVMELGSHDCKQQRVYQQLHHLWTLNSSIFKLTALHLTLQCSGKDLIKALKCMAPLQELILCIAYPLSSWEHLKSLAAKPSTIDMPILTQDWNHKEWKKWSSSQTWHACVLPSLKYLGIRSPKGFSQCLDNLPLLRLTGWTRAQLIPPLQHLDVWEGRGSTGDIVVDYISTGYLDKHLGQLQGQLQEDYDWIIVSGMVTQILHIDGYNTPLFNLSSTVLFRQLQALWYWNIGSDIHFLPDLEQINELLIDSSRIPYSLDINLPLVHTLQELKLYNSSFSWMLGRTFKQLKECNIEYPKDTSKGLSKYKGLQVEMPACTRFEWTRTYVIPFPFISSPNLQIIVWKPLHSGFALKKTVLKSLQHFLLNCSCLQKLNITIYHQPGQDSLIQFVFCDAWEQGVWHGIRSVGVMVCFYGNSEDQKNEGSHFFNQMVGHRQHYEKRWKEFTISKADEGWGPEVILRASI
jgi:hypothetical protein